MKNFPLALIGVVAVSGLAVAVWIWNAPGDAPRIGLNSASSAGNEPEGVRPVPSEADLADQKMAELKSSADRKAHLDWVVAQSWAASNMALLRRTIVADPDESVQLKAVEVALQLASKEGSDATSAVVKTSLASSKGNTRARGLKAAREKPDTALVPTLLELVDSNDPYATMALNALAYTDDERGKARITAIAKDVKCNPQLRQRAVALIAVTRDEEGHRYLIELANGEDAVLRRLAEDLLKNWNG